MSLIASVGTVIARRKDPIDWNRRKENHGKHLVGRQAPGVNGQAPRMPLPPVQSPEVPQYLLEAMAVVQGLTLDELQLGAAPTIFKYLPKKSLAFKDGLKEIIQDISR